MLGFEATLSRLPFLLMRIRTRLLLLILAILVPAFVAAVLAVGYVYQEERHAQETSVKEAVRAFALVVDNELETKEGILRALANSPALARGDIDTFSTTPARSRRPPRRPSSCSRPTAASCSTRARRPARHCHSSAHRTSGN